jgi:hypothetical protein
MRGGCCTNPAIVLTVVIHEQRGDFQRGQIIRGQVLDGCQMALHEVGLRDRCESILCPLVRETASAESSTLEVSFLVVIA